MVSQLSHLITQSNLPNKTTTGTVPVSIYRYDYENTKWHVEKHLTTDYITENGTSLVMVMYLLMVSYLFAKFHRKKKKVFSEL